MIPGSRHLSRLPLRKQPAAAAFSGTDLLFAIAGITLLAAALIAPLAHGRTAASLAVCHSNLKEVTRALTQFATDHNQTLPGSQPDEPGDLGFWYKEQVKKYVGLTGESSTNDLVFGCPADRGYTDPVPFRTSARFDFCSYAFNGLTLPGVPSLAGQELSKIKNPKRTLLAMEWTAHAPLSWHRSRTGTANHPFYNDAESVVGFVDGHVKLIPIYYDGFNAAYTRDPIPSYEYQYSGN